MGYYKERAQNDLDRQQPRSVGHSHSVMLRRQLTLRLLSFLPGGGPAVWGAVCPHPLDRIVKCGQEHLPPKMAGFSMKAHIRAPVPTDQASS